MNQVIDRPVFTYFFSFSSFAVVFNVFEQKNTQKIKIGKIFKIAR